MIVVTGATGPLNGATVDHLLERVPASEVAVAVRDVGRARRFAERGVDVRHGDYAEPASLRAAFAGADQVLLVSSSDPRADAVGLHRAAISAAVEVGVGRVLYTSHQGAALDGPFPPLRDHAATEQLLRESGLPWTSLRNGFYAHSLLAFLGPWRETGVIRVPADGPVSWTAREDEAEAAAVILASDDAHEGPTTLTAAAAVTFAEVADLASEVSARTVDLLLVDPEEWVAAQVAAGRDEFAARFALSVYESAAGGFLAGTTPLLGQLLGREPHSVRDLLAGVPARA